MDNEVGSDLGIKAISSMRGEEQLNFSYKYRSEYEDVLASVPAALYMMNSQGKIVFVNDEIEELCGYKAFELLGQDSKILIPKDISRVHLSRREQYLANPLPISVGEGKLRFIQKKDGTEFLVKVNCKPVETEQGKLLIVILTDVSKSVDKYMETNLREKEQLLAEKDALLAEKEALLKEIHHRVKNNLQVTSSLLRLQSDYIRDEKMRSLFAESQNRIRSMALVHEKLYSSGIFSKIEFYGYACSLSQLLFRHSAKDSSLIQIKTEGQPVFLSIEYAVPCGLILNELISNSLQHAFPDGRVGTITVSVKSTSSGHMALEVFDNGVGLPKNFSLEKADTFGIQLVRTLLSQLGSKVDVRSDEGAYFRISVPCCRNS